MLRQAKVYTKVYSGVSDHGNFSAQVYTHVNFERKAHSQIPEKVSMNAGGKFLHQFMETFRA